MATSLKCVSVCLPEARQEEERRSPMPMDWMSSAGHTILIAQNPFFKPPPQCPCWPTDCRAPLWGFGRAIPAALGHQGRQWIVMKAGSGC